MWLRTRLNRVRVATRLAVMMAVLLAPAMAIFTVTVLMQQRRTALDHAARNGARFCEVVRRALRFSMLENRREELYSTLIDIAREEDIEHLSLAGYDGRIGWCLGVSAPMSRPTRRGTRRRDATDRHGQATPDSPTRGS